jgi:hypothetical protein
VETPTPFQTKHASSVVSTLSCHDRVILKGYLPFTNDVAINSFVDYVLKIKRKDFIPFAERQAEFLVEHAKDCARQAQVEYQYLPGKHNKEQLAKQALLAAKGREGLILVLCVQETCPTFKLMYGDGRPRLAWTRRPQRVLYYYYNDPDFGLMHVRIQTWFPLTIQVYVNGHDWLARQLHAQKIGFVQQDNAFTECDDWVAAQSLADGFDQLDWVKLLDGWALRVNPSLSHEWLDGRKYYWVADQVEYSTDVLFTNPAALRDLYPRLLDHAALHFSAEDVLSFLGRRLHPRFDGEVLTDCKKNREPGARVKHRVKENWLKMYDKFGVILRVETVINNPREFKVRRCRERQGKSQLVWCPMNKGVSNLYHYREVSRSSNGRYLEALAAVDNPTAAYRQVEKLVEPQQVANRRHAGFNPARAADVKLFQTIMHGDHISRGFRNTDIRQRLHGDRSDPVERRRQASSLSRIFKRLHVRGVIAKIPHTYRWRVTNQGQRLLSTIITLYHQGLSQAA